jgi:anti-anti-sigma factor
VSYGLTAIGYDYGTNHPLLITPQKNVEANNGLPRSMRGSTIQSISRTISMPITKITNGDNWELLVPGRIDGATANQLELEVLAAIKGGAKELFINLSQAEWMCAAAIRVIRQYYRQMKNSGKTLLVTRPSAPILEILEMTGFKDVIVEGNTSGGAR